MLKLLIVGLGGFIGTVLRYVLNNLIYKGLGTTLFPYGTLTVNLLGCFFIGLLASLAESRASITPEIRLFIQIGILGGLTTFSTFGYETYTLLRDGQFLLAVMNMVTQLILGLFAVWLGYYIAQ
jgi:fluoride exporter